MKTFPVEHLIGREIGTATLVKELGRGAMAVVFTAYQRTLRRQIAVKILPKQFLEADAAELFQQEAEAASILSHPNIVPIYEFGEAEDFLFISMQLVQGRNLSELVKARRRNPVASKRVLPLSETVPIIIQLLEALDYAHGQDVVHCDIKPENVVLETHIRRPMITDFGLARFLRGESREEDMIRGTPLFMAPEQILMVGADPRTDIYAVGSVLFQMVVPALPLPEGVSRAELLRRKREDPRGIFTRKPSEVNPRLDPEMDRIIARAIAFEPNERYASCREFIEVLAHYRSDYLTQA
jgi:serine/threonine-protein kinase